MIETSLKCRQLPPSPGGSDQDHPQEKKCKKAKWLSEEALQKAMKRREVKGKGEKERYTHLNAVFQRIARRDKKAFLSDQYKEIEENNRMGKTRDLFKKMGSIKDRNGRDLTEACPMAMTWASLVAHTVKHLSECWRPGFDP